MKEDFFIDKINFCLKTKESSSFFNEVEDEYGIFSTWEDFNYLNHSSFYEFFNINGVDVPKFFKKTKSVKRPINEISILKFNNYFMRNGSRYKSFKVLLSVMWYIFEDLNNLKDVNVNSLSS